MTVLLDSWAWIEYFKGSKAGLKVKEYVEGQHEVLISTINIAEVCCFLLREKQDVVFAEFMQQRSFVVPLTSDLAFEAAELKVKHKMGLSDAIVLATGMEYGATIVTGDEDFKGMKNVILLSN